MGLLRYAPAISLAQIQAVQGRLGQELGLRLYLPSQSHSPPIPNASWSAHPHQKSPISVSPSHYHLQPSMLASLDWHKITLSWPKSNVGRPVQILAPA